MSDDLSLVLLLALRFGAVLRLIPFLGRFMPFIASAAFSVALSLVIAPKVSLATDTPLLSVFWIALAARELLIGIAIGCLARIVFAVFEVIGDLAQSGMTDVSQLTEMSDLPLTRLYALLGPALFLLVGGHHAFIAGLTASARSFPPAAWTSGSHFGAVGLELAIRLFSTMMGTAVLLAAPIFIAGLGADLLLNIASRFGSKHILAQAQGLLRLVVIEIAVIIGLGFVAMQSLAFLSNNMMRMTLASQF